MVTMNADRHRADGDLIGLLDGERNEYYRDVEAHVDGCAECSARLARLQERSARFSEMLRAVEPASIDRVPLVPSLKLDTRSLRSRPPRGSWVPIGVRAAAALLLLAGVAAASPVRGWILDRLTGRHSKPTPNQPGVVTPTPTSPGQAAGAVVRFATESDSLVIRIDVPPAGGTLVIVGGDERRSSAQIVGGSQGEAFLVLPDELRIRSTGGSVANYEVVLAPTIRRVRVLLGGARSTEVTTVDVAPGVRRTISLGAREGGR